MKNITKIIIGSMFAFSVLVSGTQTFAQEDSATLHDRISELRGTHQELKAQVEAGEITTTEAREKWKALLADFRAKKEAFFEEKIARVEAKYDELKEKNPERAEIFKEHIDAVRTRHDEAVEKRAELSSMVSSGELTHQQANKLKVEFVQEQRDKFQEIKANVQAKRKELQANRPDDAVRPSVRPNAGAVPSAGAVRPRPVGQANTGAVPTLAPVDVDAALTEIAGVVSDVVDAQ